MAKRLVTPEELRRKLAELQDRKQAVEADRELIHDERKARRKANMPKRNLRIVRRALPPLGICEYCNKQFKSNLPREGAAMSEIQALFDAHKCEREDFSQAAVRTVREATKS